MITETSKTKHLVNSGGGGVQLEISYSFLVFIPAVAQLSKQGRLTALRWFETVFHFPLQLNFMKGLLVCSKRLLLLVDSRCCNNLLTYQLLYSH